jgi:hypothetical protein
VIADVLVEILSFIDPVIVFANWRPTLEQVATPTGRAFAEMTPFMMRYGYEYAICNKDISLSRALRHLC